MSFNKIILVGNLTRDIELRYTQSGSAIAKTAIATTRKFTSNEEKKEEVCFVDITFFGKSAEIANQYIRKGSKILVEGRLKLDSWTDNNGQKRQKHSVIVESMQMLDTKPQNTTQQPNNAQENYNQPTQQAQQYQPPTQQQAPVYEYQNTQGQTTPPPASSVPAIDIDEDEIPF